MATGFAVGNFVGEFVGLTLTVGASFGVVFCGVVIGGSVGGISFSFAVKIKIYKINSEKLTLKVFSGNFFLSILFLS